MPQPTARSASGNLPVPVSTFIGRGREIAEVKQLIAAHRLVTLTGPGGSGKTRLALEVGGELRGKYEDGVWLVELASLSDPAFVTQAIASALDVREQAGRNLLDVLADHLSEWQALLLLDNCEHLIHACAQSAEGILKRCPGVRILATSRETLGVAGETVWIVPSLTLPERQPWRSPTSAQKALDAYGQSEAVQLFIDRATATAHDFALSVENGPWVSEICRRLDGMPLAIELAAARVRTLSAQQIAQRLDDRFHLLVGGSRTAEPRQQTLAATLEWSYALLSETEKGVLRRLSAFLGGATLEAAEAVCMGEGIDRENILDTLSHLVEKSLVVVDRREGGQTRYHLLETIRQYAREKLDEAGEEVRTRNHHLDYFSRWLGTAQPHLYGPDRYAWLNRIEAEHDNIRAALEWCHVHEEAEAGLRLAATMGYFWRVRSYITEARTRLSVALAQSGAQAHTGARARALCEAAVLAFYQSEYAVSRQLANEALSIARELGDAASLEQADALELLAEVETETGNYAAAPDLYEQALFIYRQLGHLVGIGDTLKMMGWSAMRVGDFERAEPWFNEGLVVCRQSGDLRQMNSALAGLGELAVRRGQYERAREYLQESLEICRPAEEKWGLAIALGTLGWIALLQGDFDEMRKSLRESLDIRMETGDKGGTAWCLEKLAEASMQRSQFARAATIFGAATAMRAPVQSVMDAADLPHYEHLISRLHTALGEEAFRAAWAVGRALSMEQAIAFAFADPEPAQLQAPLHSLKESYGGLTAREREVAALIAQGRSNREIAKAMTVGAKTVETYVTRILGKLGFDSRVQIATWAIEKGLGKKEPE